MNTHFNDIQHHFNQLHQRIEAATPKIHGLAGGGLGLSLYYYNRYKAFGEDADAEKAVTFTEAALEHLNDEQQADFGFTYAQGTTGLMYMLNLLQQEGLIEADMEGDFGELDAFLLNAAKDQLQISNNDFLHGVMGVVHYFLSRLPSPVIEKYLYDLLGDFCSRAITEPEGTWFRNYVLPIDDLDEMNFGLSHGQTSFLLLLMQAYQKGIRIAAIPALVQSGINLMHHYIQPVRFEAEQFSFFPTSVNAKDKTLLSLSTRLAWCYGDLNMVQVTLKAAIFLNQPALTAKAHEWGHATLKRNTPASVAVFNSHFCHGAAGLAQYYRYLHQVSGMAEYEQGAQYWLRQTLTLLPGDLEKGLYKDGETELLDGLTGINLTLLSFLSETPLTWGHALLLQ
jgi:lantibiotic biosynthesis protein